MRIFSLLILLILSSCSNNVVVREPAAYSPSYSCSSMANLFFRKLESPEVKTLDKEAFEIIESKVENYEFTHNIERFLETDDNAIIDMYDLKIKMGSWSQREYDNVKDSLGREWIVESWDGEKLQLRRNEVNEKIRSYYPKALFTQARIITLKISLNHQINIIMPNFSEKTIEIFLNEIKLKLNSLPQKYSEILNTITILPYGSRNDPKSKIYYNNPMHVAAASANRNNMYFYKLGKMGAPFTLSNFEISERVFRHEFGHNLAYHLYGSTTPPESWAKAMRLDGKSVSLYANSNQAEDFAETVELYFKIGKEGLKNPQWKTFSFRFAELDNIFLNNPNLRYEVNAMIKIRNKLPLVIALTMSSDTTYYFYQYLNKDRSSDH